ncbi:hypothetical protein B296_00007116 [Ensete ventricosum]|uniref:Uncharacterized protein n=1 Tax=Ensete ventricosum TaxID=4639 RepID=A0A427AQZ9_ENSVE|nr:hypothetical protein B296_00007116 [Ensete ventricosum]
MSSMPLSGERPYDAFSKGFNLSPDALEVGLGFPLHPMIEVCLKGWQISPSQMTPNSWRYLVAFLWECFGGVKDINEALLAEVGLSPAPRVFWLSMRKHSRRKTAEYQADASGSSTRVPSRKGKEPVAMEEAPERGYILRERCEVEDCMGAERYFTTVMARLKVTEGEDPPSSAEVGLHFITALIDRVHDAGQLVWSQHERILVLWAPNNELKGRGDQDLVATAESRVKELEGDVNKLRGELESLKTQ